MNEIIPGLGCVTPEHARQMAEFSDTHPGSVSDEMRASLQRVYEPERQYADLSVYEAPNYRAAWEE